MDTEKAKIVALRSTGIARVDIPGGSVVVSSDDEHITLERALFLLDAAKDYFKKEWVG